MFKSLHLAVIATLAIILGMTQTSAQEAAIVQSTDDLKKLLLGVNEKANGQEIQIRGAIGTLFGETIYFADGTGRYKISLDAGREIRRQVENCKLEMFDTVKSKCQIRGNAEIQIEKDDTDIADGIEIKLILFAVDSFEISK